MFYELATSKPSKRNTNKFPSWREIFHLIWHMQSLTSDSTAFNTHSNHFVHATAAQTMAKRQPLLLAVQ